MEDNFVSYEIAVKLKELGFDEKCLHSFEYGNGGLECKLNPNLKTNSTCEIGEIVTPLWQQVIDWLRIQHCILVHPFYHGKYEYKVESSIETASSGVIVEGENWNDVREKAVLKAFEVIEKK